VRPGFRGRAGPHLEFQDGVGGGGERFGADVRGGVQADAERGDMVLFAKAQAEVIVKRLPGPLGGTVQQCLVQRSQRARPGGQIVIPGGQRGQAAGNIAKGKPGGIHGGQEPADAGHALPPADGGGGFAPAGDAVRVGQFHEHDFARTGARGAGNFPRVGQAQLRGPEFQLHGRASQTPVQGCPGGRICRVCSARRPGPMTREFATIPKTDRTPAGFGRTLKPQQPTLPMPPGGISSL